MKDKQIEKLIKAEEKRQKSVVNLIPSENYVSKDVLTALGSVFNNKYSEGYSGARYYGGNKITDKIENICQARALKTFRLNPEKWAVNVQPLSGSPANLAVYAALVPIGNKIMGMSLDQGGHLTHGHKVSISGKIWKQVSYGVNAKTEMLDYGEIMEIAMTEKPDIIVAGFTAYPRQIDWEKFRKIADACGAYLMVDMSHVAGLVAGGVYPSPFETDGGVPLADIVTTTTHKTLRGPRAAMIFSRKIQAKNQSAKNPKTISELIDKAVFPGIQGGPHMNQIAAVAVALKEAGSSDFKKYARQVVKNAKVLADELMKRGWRVVSGGTDSHLLLVDVWMGGKGISGAEASEKLESEGIIVNKNTIPFDTRKPTDPSGIRLGTPAETTRGKKEKDFVKIAERIDKILRK
jgi:glycine hydroxymethyltransferase